MTQYQAATAASINSMTLRILKNRQYGAITDGVFYAPYIPKTFAALNRLPVNKYKFSRAKWYVAEYDWINYSEVSEWCRQQFGPHDEHPDAWSRWNHVYEGKIHFRDEKDYLMFLLKWS